MSITPYKDLSIQPASFDLRLGKHFLIVDDMSTSFLSVDIRRNPSGKYFVSVLVETDVQPLEKTGSVVRRRVKRFRYLIR